MAAIDQLVQIQITAATQSVTQQSFSIPLIMGSSTPGWSDRLRTYTSPAAMLTDGYTTSNPEYIYASAMAAQSVSPASFKVGRRTAAANQVDSITVSTVTVGHLYTITINGTAFTYTAQAGDTQQAILGALKTAISAAAWYNSASAVSGTGGSAALSLTTNGAAIYTNVDSLLAVANTTPGGGLAGDLALAAAQDNSWYGVCCAGATDSDIINAALWVEANKKLMVQASSTSAIGTSATSDVLSTLKAAAYKRTGLMFSPSAAAAGIDAAWMGLLLAQTPGAVNWAYKALNGITADVITDTQFANVVGVPVSGVAGKNGNVYRNVAGANITQMGQTASGQYIDITVGLDWLQSQIQTNIYATLVNAGKVPYTDVGTTLLMSCVKSAIDLGARNGLIDATAGITITTQKVADVPVNTRANRIAPNITFGCRLQGAINAVTVQGTVSV